MGQIFFKRIQFGLIGLGAALAIVVLGTLLLQQPEGEVVNAAAEPAEPLSQIGATPGVATEPEPAPEPVPPAERISVPIDPSSERLIASERTSSDEKRPARRPTDER